MEKKNYKKLCVWRKNDKYQVWLQWYQKNIDKPLIPIVAFQTIHLMTIVNLKNLFSQTKTITRPENNDWGELSFLPYLIFVIFCMPTLFWGLEILRQNVHKFARKNYPATTQRKFIFWNTPSHCYFGWRILCFVCMLGVLVDILGILFGVPSILFGILDVLVGVFNVFCV